MPASQSPAEKFRIEDVPVFPGLDPDPDLGPHVNQSFGHQNLDRLAQSGPADLEITRQVGFSEQNPGEDPCRCSSG